MRTPTISIDTSAETAVIKVSGALDIMSSHLFADAIAIAGTEPIVLVSLEECSYLDSTILSVLLRHARIMRERLVLFVPYDSCVRRMLEICKLDELLHVVSTPPKPSVRICPL